MKFASFDIGNHMIAGVVFAERQEEADARVAGIVLYHNTMMTLLILAGDVRRKLEYLTANRESLRRLLQRRAWRDERGATYGRPEENADKEVDLQNFVRLILGDGK